MRQALISGVFLLLVSLRAGYAQEPQKAQAEYDVKKCGPKLVSKKPIPTPKTIQARKGEKPTGHSPVIAFQILESGEAVNAHVKRSSGIDAQDTHALNSIRGWKFNSRPGCGTVESEATASIHWIPADPEHH